MKLVKCKKCREEVPKKEKKCPKCGVKNPGITKLESALGIAIIVAIGIGIYHFISADDEKQPEFSEYANETLKNYREKPQKTRKEIVDSYITAKHIEKSNTDVFYNCLSQMSYTKSPDLKLGEVLGWCYVDFNKNPNSLDDRINLDTFVANFSGWDGSYRPLEKMIKKTMHDDSSYKHVSTTYRLALNKQPPYAIVQTIFKGTNSYGGVVQQSIKAKIDLKTGEPIELVE
ncbi:hypothetical protein [Xenorhabdus eapokensis]|uniref:Membrane protein n=1 Tax=Xenorhabdus eapokensis TaxID=1873482 RepID=A0A1Q5TUN1_9GAMM|nr:hypothetical protein [Xenorhabdus eapokensis]OKP03942.1 membrane protein [Xenorhabdus eapokensis]